MIKKFLCIFIFTILLIPNILENSTAYAINIPSDIINLIKMKNLNPCQAKERNDKFIKFLLTFSNNNERNLAFLELSELEAKTHDNIKSQLSALYVAKIVIMSRMHYSIFYSDKDHTLALIGFTKLLYSPVDGNVLKSSEQNFSPIFLFALCPSSQRKDYNNSLFKALIGFYEPINSIHGYETIMLNIN